MNSRDSKFLTTQKLGETVDYPGTALSLAAALTVLAVCYLALLVYNIPTSMNELREKQKELILLRGEILRLDEVLTMSARMAVATGDELWIARYNRNEPILENILQQTESLVQDDINTSQATLQTDEANRQLVQMERQALLAVEKGKLNEARTILGQPAYGEQKEIYRVGMLHFLQEIDLTFQANLSQKQSWAALGLISALGFFLLLGLVWHRTLNLLIRWRNALLTTQELLAEAYNLMAMSLDSVGLGTWSYTPGETYFEISAMGAKALGLNDTKYVTLKTVLRRLEADDRKELFEAIRRVESSGPTSVELRLSTPKSERRQWVQIVFESLQKSQCYSGTINNTTQHRLRFTRLESENQKLERGVASHLKTVRDQARHLQSLALEVNEVEHRERQRLAMVLHDSLQQDLVGLRFSLASVKSRTTPELADELSQISHYVDDCIQRVRTLSIDLNPQVLQDSGLSTALEWLLGSMESRFGLKVRLKCTTLNQRLESSDIESLIFQCIRELLFNIVKHARTNEASVEISQTDTHPMQLEVLVQDKGIGFELGDYLRGSEDYTHFGLRNITSRIRAIGGTITIDSALGQGTEITFSIPCLSQNEGHQLKKLAAQEDIKLLELQDASTA